MHGPTPPLPLPTDQLQFAMPPMHDSVEDERRHRKERLAGALRVFGRAGFEDGVSGHITARDPEFTDRRDAWFAGDCKRRGLGAGVVGDLHQRDHR